MEELTVEQKLYKLVGSCDVAFSSYPEIKYEGNDKYIERTAWTCTLKDKEKITAYSFNDIITITFYIGVKNGYVKP
ncbi:MAG: hypothetical protein EOM59_11765 [Clostridia bacterium]|nr:hypothetical protein [Clostridia bacterium]